MEDDLKDFQEGFKIFSCVFIFMLSIWAFGFLFAYQISQGAVVIWSMFMIFATAVMVFSVLEFKRISEREKYASAFELKQAENLFNLYEKEEKQRARIIDN